MAHGSTEVLTRQVLLSYGIHSNEEKRRFGDGKLEIRKKLRRKSAGERRLYVRIVPRTEQRRLTAGRKRKERVKGATRLGRRCADRSNEVTRPGETTGGKNTQERRVGHPASPAV
jgi:hypothetical protein